MRFLGGFRVMAMLLVGMLTGCRSTGLEEVRKSREISGLAMWSATEAICVHDAKVDLEAKEPRMGLIDSSVTGGRYTEIRVAWPKGELANDLEAICQIPGRPREYLAAESGMLVGESGNAGREGRVFRLQCRKEGDRMTARVAQVWRWPEGTKDIEGIACALVVGQPVLFAARRSGTIYTAFPKFEDESEGRLEFVKTNVLDVLPEFQRKIGDLHIDESGILWAVATADSADDDASWNDGPFRSAIYQVGVVSNDLNAPISFDPTGTKVFVMDGLKVEGLTGTILGRGMFTIGSDDEDLGGVWRVVEER